MPSARGVFWRLLTWAPCLVALAGTPAQGEPSEPGAAEHQVQVLRELLPRVRRVGFLYEPHQSAQLLEPYQQAVRAAGLQVVSSVVEQPRQVLPLARALMSRVDVVWLLPDSTAITAESLPFLVRHSFERKVPLVGHSEGMCRGGALLTVGAPQGALCLNARAAGLLQVALPSSLLGRASLVIRE
jgi:ABC-type uncharacterized transport system substrate-binding protein